MAGAWFAPGETADGRGMVKAVFRVSCFVKSLKGGVAEEGVSRPVLTVQAVPDLNAGDNAATSFGEAAVAVLAVADSEAAVGIHHP